MTFSFHSKISRKPLPTSISNANTKSKKTQRLVEKACEQAWQLRFRQQNAEAELALEELEKSLSSVEQELQWEIRLLRVSILRAKGLMSESNRELSEVGAEIFSKTRRAPFQYYFQKAINVFVTDDFSVAMEFFLLAESSAPNANMRLSCLMNVLTCLENLSLPWDGTLSEIEKIISQMKKKTKKAEIPEPVMKQLTAFRLRSAFRSGDIHSVFKVKISGEMDQASYHRLWMSRLPYLSAKYAMSGDALQRLSRTKSFYLKAYRLKTIALDPRLKDLETAAPTAQQVDRIYLWTWNWLTDPSEQNRKLLKEVLEKFDFQSALTKMTFEDYQLLRNALSWISLFQKQISAPIERYLTQVSIRDCNAFPIFEYEQLWIEHLKLCRYGRKDPRLEQRIESHPLHGSADLRFEEFAERWCGELSRARQVPAPSKDSIVVDEESFRIVTHKTMILSEPLSKLLTALSELKVVPFSEILWSCFGTPSYEPEIHQPKIHNLIARMKDLLPESVTIKTKNQTAHFFGPMDAIIRVSPSALEKRIFENSASLKLGSPESVRVFEKPLHPRTIVERSQGKRVLRRDEFQKIMKLSKATTVRWLQRWIDQGLIRPEGAGPSMRYHIEIADSNRLTPIV